jgi:ABC-2 type transport system ATP-binding protein
MISVRDVSKRYGDTLALDRISFDVRPGMVTAFLGPNGAGKTTAMRVILGLDAPTAGAVTVDGRSYRDLPAPIQHVGSLLDARAIQGGRSAYNHLLWIAQAGGIPTSRVREVIDIVGLQDVAGRRVGKFSLGMFQRLGIATALLGDPPTLLFDEPVNGLDPEGIAWIRKLMRRLAAEGRTVFVSSHLMSEMEDTADHVLVIGKGRLIADLSMDEFITHSSGNYVRVASPRAVELAALLREGGAIVNEDGAALLVTGMAAPDIGDLAAARGIALHELSLVRATLEAAFMELTHDAVQYRAGGEAAAAPLPLKVGS